MIACWYLSFLSFAGAVVWDAPVPAPPGVKVDQQRLVLVTDAGSIIIALYPEVAPITVQQIKTLVNAGVYQGTCFPRIEKNFVLQLSAAESDRQPPLSARQRELIRPLPAEFSKLKHIRGVVSMAREDGNINSARTSFSILLGPASNLDDKYTIFGHVEMGMDVVDELAKAPLAGNKPRVRLKVLQAGFVSPEQLLRDPPPPARALFQQPDEQPQDSESEQLARRLHFEQTALPMKILASVGILLMIACGLLTVFMPRLTLKHIRTLNLIAVLIGAFILVALLQPLAWMMFQTGDMINVGHVIAIAIFFGLLGVFRLMSSFENPA